MAIDPVCGMEVDEGTGIKAEKNGKFYYFCSEHCKKEFIGELLPVNKKAVNEVKIEPYIRILL